MRRLAFTFALILALTFAAAGTAGAQSDSDVQGTLGLDVAASVTQVYVAPDAAVVFSPGLFGIGGGAKAYVGVPYGDFLAAPYVRGEIGLFYLNLGGVLEISEPRERSGKIAVSISDLDVPISPYIVMGLSPTLFQTPGGRIQLDLSLEGFFSGFYVDESEDVGEALGLAAVLPFGLALNFPKASIGVTYAYGL